MDGIASQMLADEARSAIKRAILAPKSVSPTLCSHARTDESVRLVLLTENVASKKNKNENSVR